MRSCSIFQQKEKFLILNCQERSLRAVTTLRETRSLEQPDLFTPPHHLKVSPADFLRGPIIGFGQIQSLWHGSCTSFEVLFRTRYFIPLKIETSKKRTNLKYYKSPRSPKAWCLSIWWRKNLGAPGSTRKEATGPKTPSNQRKTTPKRISRRSSSSKDLPDIEENRHHHHQRQEENRPPPDPHATQHQGDLDPELALDVVLDAPHPLNLVADLALLSVVVSFDVKDPPVRGDNPALFQSSQCGDRFITQFFSLTWHFLI